MRTILVALLALIASPALAADDCSDLAARLSIAHAGFPEIVGSPEQLVTWRASCAETAPHGPGSVVALCESDTVDGLPVFYWLKASSGGQSSGYERCAYDH